MKTFFLLFFLDFSFLPAFSKPIPDTASNPVVFFEIILGHAYGRTGGLAVGVNVNYQVKNILFTGRFTETTKLRFGILSPIIPFPYIEPKSSMEEFAILFGRRFTKEKLSYSFSLGISHNHFVVVDKASNNTYNKQRFRFIGVPFEANLKFFPGQKKRYKIFGFIPTGQRPVAFGRSIGLKFFTNFSEYTMGGIGLTFGWGTHKQY